MLCHGPGFDFRRPTGGTLQYPCKCGGQVNVDRTRTTKERLVNRPTYFTSCILASGIRRPDTEFDWPDVQKRLKMNKIHQQNFGSQKAKVLFTTPIFQRTLFMI